MWSDMQLPPFTHQLQTARMLFGILLLFRDTIEVTCLTPSLPRVFGRDSHGHCMPLLRCLKANSPLWLSSIVAPHSIYSHANLSNNHLFAKFLLAAFRRGGVERHDGHSRWLYHFVSFPGLPATQWRRVLWRSLPQSDGNETSKNPGTHSLKGHPSWLI